MNNKSIDRPKCTVYLRVYHALARRRWPSYMSSCNRYWYPQFLSIFIFMTARSLLYTRKWTRTNCTEYPMNGRFGAFPISLAINYCGQRARGISICAVIFVFKSINGHWRGHDYECWAFGACITDDFVVFSHQSIIKLMKCNRASLVASIVLMKNSSRKDLLQLPATVQRQLFLLCPQN